MRDCSYQPASVAYLHYVFVSAKFQFVQCVRFPLALATTRSLSVNDEQVQTDRRDFLKLGAATAVTSALLTTGAYAFAPNVVSPKT